MKKEDLITEWLEYSRRDLKSAEYLTGMLPEPLEIICFHCQQSAEKALKAYLISIDIRPPKTHDLDELLELCKNNDEIVGLREESLFINDYSIIVRYPGISTINIEDKNKALSSAHRIFEVINNVLRKLVRNQDHESNSK